MSTPEEQQRQQQQQQQQYQDPYGTQTWQSDTWDTAHQPVAPEGWFRDEVPAPAPAPSPGPAPAPVQEWGETAYLPPYPGPEQQVQQAQPQYRQTAAPDSWFRDEVPAPAPAPAPAPVQEWGETAYLPPYPGPEQQVQQAQPQYRQT
ncbi:hypothetical protein ACGFYK_30695, partial [Streptomyces sp. NPDC048340]